MDNSTPGNNHADYDYSDKGGDKLLSPNNNSNQDNGQQYNGGNGQNGVTGYCDLFFHFMIDQELRLSEQAVVLTGMSIAHQKQAVLKQFDLRVESKAFKKELEVLAKI